MTFGDFFRDRANLRILMHGSSQSTQDDFLAGFQNGQESCFTCLFKEWYPAVCYFAQSILKDVQEAEDITEDGFIKLWERRNEFSSMQGCKSFLYTVVRNDCIKIIRHRKVISANEKGIKDLTISNNNFIDQIISAELAKQLQKALEELPSECRKVFYLAYKEGKTNKEVAETLQLSIHTVKAQKKRGLFLLRKKMLLLVLSLISFI